MLAAEVIPMRVEHEEGPEEVARRGGRVDRFVVVGVDGSPQSSKALAFAADEARMRKATLKVVEAWSFPTFAAGAYVPAGAYEDFPEDVASSLDAQVAEVLGTQPAVAVEKVVEEGATAQVILEVAKGAELLVVGSRGRGGFTGLLLGSVSNQVAHHASCPVAIVRS